MGLLCLSRQNERARKVCPVLHGWWCVLRLPGRPSCSPLLLRRAPSSQTLCLSSPFHCFRDCLPLPARQSRDKPTPMVYFGRCLIACVAVFIFFLPVFVVGFFLLLLFLLIWFLFCSASLHHIGCPCFSRCWMPKSELKEKLCIAAGMLLRFSWEIFVMLNFIVNWKLRWTALKDFRLHGPFEPPWQKSNRPF